MGSQHADEFINLLQTIESQNPPNSWKKVATVGIGGLTDVGYADNSDLLLVVSTQGRGVFDCITGKRLARIRENELDEDEWYYWRKLKALGIGPLEGQMISIAGLFGGGLLQATEDNWELEAIQTHWPDTSVVLIQPHQTFFWEEPSGWTKIFEEQVCEFRTYGFSETGCSFVIATSCQLHIFSRE